MKNKATKYNIAVVVADFLFKTIRYQKAIDLYKEAQVLLNENKEENLFIRKMELCLLHFRLARVFYKIDSFNEALINYNQVLKISEEMGNKAAEVQAYQGISAVYSSLDRQAHVIFYQRKLLEIARGSGDKLAEARACVAIGYAYYKLRKLDKSIEYQNEALRISREIGDREGEVEALDCLDSAYKELSQYDKAVSHLERALRIHRDTGNHRAGAESFQVLGNTYHEFGAYEKALYCHNKALEMMTTLGDVAQQGVCYNNIGTTFGAIGRYDEALEHFVKTLEIMTNFGNKGQEGRAHYSLGLCYGELGQYNKSLEHHENALEILQEAGDRFGEGRSCSALGRIYNMVGHFTQAINFGTRALKIAAGNGDRKVESNAYLSLGEAYFALDPQSGQGETYVKKALEISKDTGDKQQLALDNLVLAAMYRGKGQYMESLEHHKYALEMFKEIGARGGEAQASCLLASVYIALGKFTEGKKHLKKTLHIIREGGVTGMEYNLLYLFGVCSIKDKEFEKAREYLYESIVCIERDRKLLSDECKLSLDNLTFHSYTVLYELLIIQGDVAEALCTAERGRARALVDLMSNSYGEIHVHVAEIKHLSIQSQSMIIFMAIVHETIYFWVIEEDGKVLFRLSKCESREEGIANLLSLSRKQLLRTLLDGRRSQCEDRSLSAYYKAQSPAVELQGKVTSLRVEEEDGHGEDRKKERGSGLHLLYRRLFAPVADLIQRLDIVFVPEGDLWMVPFPALKDADGKFLSETYRIRLIPSLTALQLIQASPDDYHKATGALIVGDPDVHPMTKLTSLPEARKEAQEIADLLGVTATVGRQATKAEVLRRIQEVSLIHIAAHGDAERGEIALSSNRISPQVPRKEDFMLTMEDVAKVGIRAKLVVLSCCHSGRGEIMKSEGVVGIARAFLASGARSVLVSLWVLDDKSTKEFMIRFYKHLVRDKLSASQAVHQCRKWMRETADFNSVFDWAPFVLIGDDVKLNL